MGLHQVSADSTSRLHELASGIDALYVSGRASIPQKFLEELERLRASALETGRSVPLAVGKAQFHVLSRGFGKYRYSLRNEFAQIGVTDSANLPALRIQPRAEYLHGVGPLEAVDRLADHLGSEVGPIALTVSRLDLFADFQGWALDGDSRHRFVCRARRRDLYEEDNTLTGSVFGSRGTGTVLARIYDKDRERQKKGTDYWLAVWGDRYVAGSPVWRVEFELGRQALAEYGIDTPVEAAAGAGGLWAAVSDDWLTYRTPSADGTRSRWPLAPEWKSIQFARVRGEAAGVDLLRASSRDGKLRILAPSLVGNLSDVGAVFGVDSIEEVSRLLPSLSAGYEKLSRRTFADRVREKMDRAR